MAVGLGLVVVDPFDVGEVTEVYSEDLADLVLFGPDYGAGSQDSVAVVLVGDQTLKGFDLTWPVRLDWHARFLEALLQYKPAAVFVDIAFLDQRMNSGVGEFLSVVEQYQLENVQLIFASVVDEGELQVREDLRGHIELVPLPAMEEARQTRLYPLSVDVESEEGIVLEELRTPAMKMLEAAKPELTDRVQQSASDIRVIWGTQPHPINAKWMDCTEISESFLSRFMLLVRDTSLLRQTCAHPGFVPAETLFAVPLDQDIIDMVSGRYVFFGASLEGTGDLVYTLNYGDIPGVFFHAMAFDNLLTLGNDYRRDEAHIWGRPISTEEVNFVLAAMLITLLVIYLPFEDRLGDATWNLGPVKVQRRRLALMGFLLGALAVLLPVQFALAALLNLSVGNWIALYALISVLAGLSGMRPARKLRELGYAMHQHFFKDAEVKNENA